MAYTNLQLLRKMLSDPFRDGFDDLIADDETNKYQLTHKPVKEDSVIVAVNNAVKTEGTDYDIDLEQGLISFDDPPPQAEQLIEVQYKYSVFSDEEFTNFLALDGDNVDKVILRCVEILLFDSARRFDYEAGLTNMKPDQVFQHLKDLQKLYSSKVNSSGGELKMIDRINKSYGYDTEDHFIGQESVDRNVDLTRDDGDWSGNNV